ncbi:hypothetical protein CCO03_03750 [Comamonas serinivorans]|uniref:Toprim domain-containing protein n=1 Tax=Comamonas serinivorans TaxID=1082851 RepID=A0A1Y0EKF6_9BURK|nr:PriCT-2 domain-containing protein [Comamonas serinivorans]ARU03911.1 hypothetical protein CCO03_03750 [Comamonas serinivorans]
MTVSHATDIERVRTALSYLDFTDRDVWVKAAMCIKSEFGDAGFEIWDGWGSQHDKHTAKAAKSVWKSVKGGGKTTIASLFYDAKNAGWRDDKKYEKLSREVITQRKAEAARRQAQAEVEEAETRASAASHSRFMWDQAEPCEGDGHPYLARKGVKSYGLRVGAWEKIDHEHCEVETVSTQALLIPIWAPDKTIHSLQAIFTGKVGDRDKDFVKDGAISGNYYSFGKPVTLDVQGTQRMVILIGEGYATLASAHKATGHACIVAFHAGNVPKVAQVMRTQFPDAALVFLADNDRNTKGNPGVTKAREAADAVGGLVAVPQFEDGEDDATDFNDLHALRGLDAVREAIEAALRAAPPPRPGEGIRPVWLVPDDSADDLERAAFVADLVMMHSVGMGGRIDPAGVMLRTYSSPAELQAILDEVKRWTPNARTHVIVKEALAQEIAGWRGVSRQTLAEGESWVDDLWAKLSVKAGELMLPDLSLATDDQVAVHAQAEQVVVTEGAASVTQPAQSLDGHFYILGHDHGVYFVFKHATGQIADITKRDLTEVGLIELAPLNWWEHEFPAGNGGRGTGGGINKTAAAEFIIRTAEKRGIFDPSKVRGRGAWMDDGRVVFHAGTHLVVDGVATELSGIKSRHIYTAAAPLGRLGAPATDDEGQHLLEVAKMARWVNPDSAQFLVGWLFVAPVCGALGWRPHIWITGGKGSGKSTLVEDFVTPLLGKACLVFDGGGTSEAGIRQSLSADARPVLIDESETDDDENRRQINKVLQLARSSSSAGAAKLVKGTVGGKALSFHIRSMFCLASVNMGLVKATDISRFALLNLRPEGDNDGHPDHFDEFKQALLGIELDGKWSDRLLARALSLAPIILATVKVFAHAIERQGKDRRFADQHGTLLAGAWCLTHSEEPSQEQADEIAASISWDAAVVGRAESVPDEQKCLQLLLDSSVPHHGDHITIRSLVKIAHGLTVDGLDIKPNVAKRMLTDRWITVSRQDGVPYLAIRHQSTGVNELLGRSRFGIDWAGHLARLSGYKVLDNTSFGGADKKGKAHGIPMATFLSEDEPAF